MTSVKCSRWQDRESTGRKMERFFRFSDYDIWAYLPAGTLAIAAWDFSFGTNYVLKASWSPADGVVILFSAYVVGQILATPSSWLLERLLVARVLLSPSVNLLIDSQVGFRKALQRTILGDYYSPFEKKLRDRIVSKAGANVGLGEPMFWCAYPIAKRDPTALSRMAGFLNQYGFCRNIAFVAMLAVMFDVMALCGLSPGSGSPPPADHLLNWATVSLVGSLLIFHRFLKFYRLYMIEVFVAYLESEEKPRAN